MGRSRLRRTLVALSLCASLGPGATAQSGPGLPDLIYDSSELFTIISKIGQPQGPRADHGHTMMHDGYLAVLHARPGGVEFYDLSNPYRPSLVKSITEGVGLAEPHTFAQTTAYGGQHVVLIHGQVGLGGTGLSIWDWTDIFHPLRLSRLALPGVPGGYATGVFWLFYQAPYVYCAVGSHGLFIVDATDPANPVVARHLPTSQTGGFNLGTVFALGNLLVATNSDGGPGFALFDLSDPLEPVLLSSTMATPIPYGAQLNRGRLLVPAIDGTLQVFEIGGPSPFKLVNQVVLPGNRGGFTVVQDGYAHTGASTAYAKIRIGDDASYALVGAASADNDGGDEDYATPLGNLVAVGDDQGFGTAIVPHQSLPDNSGPEVTMVVPQDHATGLALTSRVGITTSDMIELTSIDTGTFIVRPAGGSPLLGSYSNQFGIVNFTPARPLTPDTTYEVVVPAGGLRDWSGNAVPSTFKSRFSTGGELQAIDVTPRTSAPVQPGRLVTFDVAAVSGPGPFQYSWDFGDGTQRTPFSTYSPARHAYAAAGHYTVLVTVKNGTITGTSSFIQTVHHPLTRLRPTRSGTIALDEAGSRLWCVNVDNDTVTAIDTQSLQRVFEVPVGRQPRTLAQAGDGTIWVVCEEDATVHLLDPTDGSNVGTLRLPYASAPYGLAMSPDGRAAYVTLGATGEVAKLDPALRKLLGTARVGPTPKGIAIAADSERIFVTRFISSPGAPAATPSAQVYELSAAEFSRVRAIPLALDPGPDTEGSGRGLPNYLSSLTISPDGRRIWVPSKKDNTKRGLYLDGQPLTFESTVRTIVSQIDLVRNREDLSSRIDLNDRDLAFAVELSPLGDYAFSALSGSNAVDVRDAYTEALVAGIEGTGLAPQGLVMTSDGATLFVHNFMSRTVAAYDVSGVTSQTHFAIPLRGTVSTVAHERLSPPVLRGKQIFYNGTDPRLNEDGYVSCASCHLDGGHDGRVWDLTDRGEGLRNTISLIGKSGTRHGNVHWTASFDEIQDFENDMRFAFRGDGFMDDAVFHGGTVSDPLGQPKAGLSEDLDALAAYVSSLTQFGLSPYRNSNGTLTAAGQSGKALFERLNCAHCHAGPAFTDSASAVLHDVGTIKAGSGQALGGPLVGLDTPTLRGLWATAPYLHDGSAATLLEVITSENPQGLHGATDGLTPRQKQALLSYLLQIDDLEPGP